MKIKEVATQIRGVSYKPENASDTPLDNYVPLLRAHNIQGDGLNLERLVYVDKSKVKPDHYIRKGDIVVCASSGSLHLVGKAAQATHDYDAVFGAFCKIVRPNDSVNAEYVGHFFQSDYYRGKIASVSEGANINNIRAEHIDEIAIPLPPFAEQHHIAAMLDKATAMIADRKGQLEQLDLLVKSRFVANGRNGLEVAA